MTVQDIADEIYRELDQPDDVTVPSLAFWLSTNIGQLNTLLNLNTVVGENEQFEPELTIEESAIFKQIYILNYYSRKIRSNLGEAGYTATSVTEGDRSVRVVSKNEIAKSYHSLRKDSQLELATLVASYKINHAVPRQVLESMDDEYAGTDPFLAYPNSRSYYDLD